MNLSTFSVATQVATMTGKTDENATIAIFDQSNTPNHKMKIGRKAILGNGLPTETIGSKNQRTRRDRAMVTPNERSSSSCRMAAAPAAAIARWRASAPRP